MSLWGAVGWEWRCRAVLGEKWCGSEQWEGAGRLWELQAYDVPPWWCFDVQFAWRLQTQTQNAIVNIATMRTVATEPTTTYIPVFAVQKLSSRSGFFVLPMFCKVSVYPCRMGVPVWFCVVVVEGAVVDVVVVFVVVVVIVELITWSLGGLEGNSLFQPEKKEITYVPYVIFFACFICVRSCT